MHLLVGLGNPGKQYEQTRHNIGFRLLDRLAEQQGLRFAAAPRFRAETAEWSSPVGKVLLVKPQTFMNHSGESVGPIARYYNVAPGDISVAFDDLDLPSGKLRLRHGGGHGGHNGLKSLNQHLPDNEYVRIKLGIGRPPQGDVTGWVLGRADEGGRADEERMFAAVLPEIEHIIEGGLADAANRIHLAMQP